MIEQLIWIDFDHKKISENIVILHETVLIDIHLLVFDNGSFFHDLHSLIYQSKVER